MTPFTYRGACTGGRISRCRLGRNARAAGAGTLSRGRTSREIKIVELDAEQSRPVLRDSRSRSVGVGFAKRSGSCEKGPRTSSKRSQADWLCSGST